MPKDYKYFKELNEDLDAPGLDYFKMSDSQVKRAEKLQASFRVKMDVLKKIQNIDSKNMTDEKRASRDSHLRAVERIVKELDAMPHGKADGFDGDITVGDGTGFSNRNSKGYEVRNSHEKKDFRSLFGNQPLNQYHWEDRDIDFFNAVFSGRFHPGLQTRAMSEGIASDGGFLVPVETAEQIHNVSLESEIVMPGAMVVPMKSNDKHLPGLNIGDHSSNLFGGFTASYKAEAGTLTQANPKARSVNLGLKKLTGLIRMSREIFDDVQGGGQQIVNICGGGLGWYRDKAFLKGSGAGEPLGILNSPCLVSVAKESGQNAETVIYENLVKMLGRLFAGSFKNAVWVAHQTLIPQLLTLSVPVGTGGSHIPAMVEGKDGTFKILTRPVIFTEKTETLGTKGDIMLCDFSQYVIGLREEMRIEYSSHVYFATDEIAARLIERHDGMPIWDEALTLEDGSTTVSPFVTLDERA